MDHKAEQEIADHNALLCLMESMDEDDTLVRLLEIEIDGLDQSIERVSEYAMTHLGARHIKALRSYRAKLIAKLHKEVDEWYKAELADDARRAPIYEWLDDQEFLDNSGDLAP